MAGFIHGVDIVEVADGPRPVTAARTGVIGIVGTAPDADAAVFPLDQPVLIAGSRQQAADLDTVGDGNGSLPAAVDQIFRQIGALIVVVRVADDADPAAERANVQGSAVAGTGIHALIGAQSATGFTPKILCAPGYSSYVTRDGGGDIDGAPVAADLVAVADKLQAIAVCDGPDTDDAEALDYVGLFDSYRLYTVDPGVVIDEAGTLVSYPASAMVCGVIAKTDDEIGFWRSPSNRPLLGLSGTTRAVDYRPQDSASGANLLNEGGVATIIRENGYRLWGNRVPTTDPKWAFMSVRRIADQINESLRLSHLWAVDRGITATYVSDVLEGVEAYLRSLKARGAILGGRAWFDPDLNDAAAIQAGQAFFDFEFTPVYPAERPTFRSRLTDAFIEEVVP